MESASRSTGDPKPGSARGTGVFNVYTMSKAGILVNINAETRFEYRTLYRISSLAMKAGGVMEACNEDIAVFSFPKTGIGQFMEGIGFEIRIRKTVVSPTEKGISKVNIRFQEK